PCEGGHGIVFSVHNEQGSALIPALTPFVAETRRRVVLAKDGVWVQTVEHLLAACFGMGITNLLVEVDGSELPIGDGSAQLWVDAFKEAGVVCLNEPAPLFSPTETVTVQDGNALITVAPNDRFTATVTFVTDHPLVGVQTATFDEETDDFVTAIAPARTFGFWEEVEALLTQGLAKGGSLDNALVVFPDRYSSPLRFPDELARHKLLDLMGDLMLLGRRLTAKVTAKASGHSLHHRLCQTLWHQVAQEAKA
ncbi:MAG: UDP-3-O-acyl-N-acetylglucosamine deacetylase, partial [Armatimonadota bacterium]|nr:UDP-3-O-acyl-N-acetylglucosamine deacetylase [Armatimonadota bacterium]